MARKRTPYGTFTVIEYTPQTPRASWPPGRPELASDGDLEQAFITTWARLGYPDVWERLVRLFPTRKIRFDSAAGAPHYVAVEIDGGTWVGGRHVTGTGFDSDCETANLAAAHGWRAFRLTTSMLANNPACTTASTPMP